MRWEGRAEELRDPGRPVEEGEIALTHEPVSGPTTQAERVYAEAYPPHEGGYGIPDRKIVAGLPDVGQTILSVGSGDGSDLWFLASANRIFALDASPSAVERAKEHGLIASQHDLEQPLPFKDGEFDIVVCKDLLEHLVDPAALLLEMRRVLKASGHIVLSIPNHFYFPFRLRILFGGGLIWKSLFHDHRQHFSEWNYMHLRFFTYRGLLQFLDFGGFQVERAFWDFGLLAHYASPDMFHEHMVEKYRHRPLTRRAKRFFSGLFPLWRAFNFVFPPRLRAAVVRIAPGLLCAGFYLRCVKK